MKLSTLLCFLLIFTMQQVMATHLYPEKYYQKQWCEKWQGRQEVRLYDSTRIDCETKSYVVEFDFAKKWAESIGQSLHYARLTGKKPAIILIVEDESDFKYYQRIKPLCEKYDITLWYMTPPTKPQTTSKDYIYFDYEQILSTILNYFKDFIESVI